MTVRRRFGLSRNPDARCTGCFEKAIYSCHITSQRQDGQYVTMLRSFCQACGEKYADRHRISVPFMMKTSYGASTRG